MLARTLFESQKSSEFSHQELARTGTALERLKFFDKLVNWHAINQALADINWDLELLNNSVAENDKIHDTFLSYSIYDKIHYILEQICVEYFPKGHRKKRNQIPRDRRILMKKRRSC